MQKTRDVLIDVESLELDPMQSPHFLHILQLFI